MPRISVIIPAFNAIKDLKRCLDSVIAAMQEYGDAELVIVDNGSTDGSYEMLLQHYGGIARVFQLPDATVGALRNYGAQVAQGEYSSFIDSDMLVPPSYLTDALLLFSQYDIAALVCRLSVPESPHWIEDTWRRLHRRPRDGYVHLYGGSFIIRTEVFRSAGGFNESLVTDEDRELGERLESRGYRIYEASAFSAIHLGEPRTLRAFFRRHLWHGLGMLGNFQRLAITKPTLMTFLHLILSIAGLLILFFPMLSPSIRLLTFASLACIVPAATVAYRQARGGDVSRPLRAFLLYYLYYSARACALLALPVLRFRGGVRPHDFSPRR